MGSDQLLKLVIVSLLVFFLTKVDRDVSGHFVAGMTGAAMVGFFERRKTGRR
jgi:hypothetical protein